MLLGMQTGCLHHGIPAQLPEELTEVLAAGKGPVRIERIISRGQASPHGFWYDQAEAEWVGVIQGKGHLLFEEDERIVQLKAGDWILIHPHERHRVEWTCPKEDTVWLTVFFTA